MTDCSMPLPHSPASDAINLGALTALVKLSLAVPGSLDSNFFDEVGQMLYETASELRPATSAISDNTACTWPTALQEAESSSVREAHLWLGRQLGNVSHECRPFFLGLLERLDQKRAAITFRFAANLRLLCDVFELNTTESRLLELAAVLENSLIGVSCLEADRPALKVHKAIAAAIDTSVDAVRQALRTNGRLAHTGLLKSSSPASADIHEMLTLSAFGRHLFQGELQSIEQLCSAVLFPVGPNTESSRAQRVVSNKEQQMAQAIVENALAHGTAGVNILVYGGHPANRTDFAKYLFQVTGAAGYEVPCETADGFEIRRHDRLARLNFAHRLSTVGQSMLMMLDDAPEIFKAIRKNPFLDEEGGMMSRKAWISRLLETNPHPTLWLRDDIDDIDAGYLSQFTFCLRMARPDVSVRRQIAEQYLVPAGVTEAAIAAVVQHKEFSAELVSSIARTTHLAGDKAGSRDEAALCHLNSYAKALQMPAPGQPPKMNTRFDMSYLHLEGRFTAEQITAAVVRNGTGTILMNGPPGTGKTQLAQQIADRLGRELLYLTASDVNTKWYGESERKVAKLFAMCDPHEQIIFLDEGETLLGARERATHRASESITAEFLRQLEPFPGVFICATNHLTSIDGAMIRRFTFRLDFKPMTFAQRAKMLQELAGLQPECPLPEHCQHGLMRLDGLTPGDFANVKKRFDLLNHTAALDDWLAELRLEWAAKPHKPAGAGIGFL